jgi:ATP-dependent Clp protease protease subunit
MRYILDCDDRVRLTEELMHKLWKLPRFVTFSGEFNEESARKFREELEMTEDAAISAKQEIIPIIIDSYGGSVYSLMSMIDAINACKVKIATIVEAKAMSCGAALFTCGAEGHRYVGPNATIMIHSAAGHAGGKIHEAKADIKELDRLNSKIFKIMDKNCGKADGYFWNIVEKEKHMADWFMDAEEAVAYNLANHVGLPKMHIDVKLTHEFKL